MQTHRSDTPAWLLYDAAGRSRSAALHCWRWRDRDAPRQPATSVVRTIADLGRRLPLAEAVAALDMALHRRLLELVDLRSWAGAHPRYRGLARLRRAIELAEPATESVMETRLRLLLMLAPLPRPLAQISLYDEDGHFVGRPDFYYPLPRLALEYDGSSHRENLTGDNRRQNRMVDAGYRLLRFTAADVLSAPDSVVALVKRALSAPSREVISPDVECGTSRLSSDSTPSFGTTSQPQCSGETHCLRRVDK